MDSSRSYRAVFVGTLLSACFGMAAMTAYLVGWPIYEEYKTLRPLLKQLRDGDDGEKQRAGIALTKLGRKGVPGIIDILRDESSSVRTRFWATNALEGIGPEAGEAIPVLIDMLSVQEGTVGVVAGRALAHIDPQAERVLPLLVAVLKDEDRLTGQGAAAYALSQFDAVALPKVIELLGDPDSRVRLGTVSGFGRIRPASRLQVDALLKATSDEDASVRATAIYHLGELQIDATKSFIQALSDEDALVRLMAVCALGKTGVESKDVKRVMLGVIEEAVNHPDRKIRSAALTGVVQGRFGVDGLPIVRRALNDNDATIRRHGISVLSQMEVDPSLVVPEVERVIDDEDPGVRRGAMSLLERIAPDVAARAKTK